MANPALWPAQGALVGPAREGTGAASLLAAPAPAAVAVPAAAPAGAFHLQRYLPWVSVRDDRFRVDNPDAYVYRVRSGDYWTLIASSYEVPFAELRAANRGLWEQRGEVLYVGDELSIPGLSAEDKSPSLTYTVRSGDSWHRVAAAYGVPFWHLRMDNRDLWRKRGAFIRPGDELLITPHGRRRLATGSVPAQTQPAAAREAVSLAPSAATETVPAPPNLSVAPVDRPVRAPAIPPGSSLHIVQAGDSWFSIAGGLGLSFETLRAANPTLWAARGQGIRVGDQMIIPPHGSPPRPPNIQALPEPTPGAEETANE